MTINEIKAEIEKVEGYIFMEQMADFMNWGNYYKLRARKAELQEMLKKAEG